jgi:O-antigen/teichoic acid export membrane protein/O-antigen ligase
VKSRDDSPVGVAEPGGSAVARPNRRRRSLLTADRRSLGGSLVTAGVLQLVLVASGVVVARSLGAEDRGYLALLIVISGICTLVGSLGIFSATTYYMARDLERSRRIVRSLLGQSIVQTAATLALQIALLIPIVANDPRRVQVAAAISLLLTPGLFAYGFGEAILLGQQRFTAFNIFRAVPTTAYAAFVLLVFVLGLADIVVVMTIWAGANFLGGLLVLGMAVRGLPRSVPDGPIPSPRTMTGFGLRSLIGSLSPIEAFRADQAIVGLFLNPVALGLYVVAQAFTNLPRVAAQSIGYVAYPRIAASPDDREARRRLWKYFFVGAAVSGLMAAALALVAPLLIGFFFGNEFVAAVPVAQVLLIGSFFVAARRLLADGMRGLGYPGLGTIAEISCWIVLVPAVAVLLPHGAMGVALALTIAWAVSFALAIVFAVCAGNVVVPDGVSRLLRPGPGLALFVAWAFAVAAAGTAATALPLRSTLVIAIALVGALFFGFCRGVLRARAERASAEEAVAPEPEPEVVRPVSALDAPDLPFARALYYLGLILLALLTVRVTGQVTFSDVFFLFSMAVACAELVILRRRVPMPVPLLLLGGMTIFTVGGLLSSFESYAAFKSIAIVCRLILLTVFWFWLGTVVLTRPAHVSKALVLWVVSAAVCGTGAILQFVAGDVIPNTSPVFSRSTGFTAQPNDLGGLTAIAFVPALMLAAREGVSKPRRLLGYLMLLLVTAGLVLSGSVGAMLAAAAAIFVWFALQRRPGRSLRVFGVMVAAVLAITTFQSMRGAQTPLSRLHHVTAKSVGSAGAGSLDSRIATYRVAVAEIKHDPFVGVGLDLVSVTKPFGIVSYEYDVHNLIIGTWYKAGLFGLIGMLVVLYAVFKVGWRAILETRSDSERMTVAALLSSVAAFVVFAMGAPVMFSRYGWIPAALLLALRAVQLRESGAQSSAAERPRQTRHLTAKASAYAVAPHSSGLNPA